MLGPGLKLGIGRFFKKTTTAEQMLSDHVSYNLISCFNSLTTVALVGHIKGDTNRNVPLFLCFCFITRSIIVVKTSSTLSQSVSLHALLCRY